MGKLNRYFLKLSYKGTNFHGWQIQENASSVQETINNALSLLIRSEINVVGCGRTDTGVHARQFYAHFDLDFTIEDLEKLIFKVNSFLCKDIYIQEIYKVSADLHARFSAKSRTYHYYIHQKKNPFNEELSYFFPHDLDLELMNRAAQILFDYNDFTSFSKSHTDTKTNLCTIKEAKWKASEEQLVFHITADRFLRNMVRAIVGTLLEVGRHKMNLMDFRNVIEQKNRSKAGVSVPAHGLFLEEIIY